MEGILNSLYNFIMNTIDALGLFGPILASILIVIESIIPPLPLFIFITINFVAFGNLTGFLISWICTIIGCIISYYLSKKIFRKSILKHSKKNGKLSKCLNYIKKLNLGNLTIILSIPFTPAFLVNIAAGISDMDLKKFIIAIVISKIFVVLFWGLIGATFLESLQNPKDMIIIILMILIAYLLSIIIKKIFKIE